MRDFFVYILKNSFIIHLLYNAYYRAKNKKKFLYEINRRRMMSIFDVMELSQPIPFCPIENVKDSNYYGYVAEIKKYCGVKKCNAAIEHGIYLGDRVSVAESYRTTKSIVVMSQNRLDSFEKHGLKKPALAIGPYIHYAAPILTDDEFNSLKNKYGRILLVMPVHSAERVKVSTDMENFISFVNSIRGKFDSVFICLYCLDILNDSTCVDRYKKEGYIPVTAGHKYDTSFVRRLKSIIMLADFVVSNSHGTNTGFCSYLNKPQYIFRDNTLKKSHRGYTEEVKMIRDKQVEKIESAFNNLDFDNIFEEQRKVVEEYWGTSLIKSPEEMRSMIEWLNNVDKWWKK